MSAANYLIPIRSLDQTTENEADLRVDTIAKDMNKYMGEEKVVLNELISGMILSDNFEDAAESEDYIRKADERNDGNQYFIGLDDRNFIKAGGRPSPDYDPTERQWYVEALGSENGIFISEPYTDAATGELVMTISQAFKTLDGQAGVIGVDIFIDGLMNLPY